jgi:hypothetical protein
MDTNTSRFLYHAHAVGVAGRITRPFEETIAVQAASALSASGGYSSARQEPYRLREVFSHKGVHTEATGSHSPKTATHDTVVTATVDGFNLCDVVLADSFTARITSVHPERESAEPRITPQGSMFHKLRIAGKDIILESKVDDYDKLDSMGKLREHYKSNAQFRETFRRDAFVGQEAALPETRQRYFPWRRHQNPDELPEQRGVTIVPLFVVKNPSSPGFEVHGNVIWVQDFGRIHIGELVISAYERRVTMLHVDLGSPIDGSIDAASVDGNGTETPPI